MKTIQIFICLMLLPAVGMAQSFTDSEAKEIASIVYDQYVELCENVPLSETVRSVGNDSRYVPFTEGGAVAPDGEVWMIDRNTLSQYNLEITARGGPNRCQLALWPNAGQIYPHLVSLVDRSRSKGGFYSAREHWLNHISGPYLDNIIEKHQFRVIDWGTMRYYDVIEVFSYESGSSVIGKFRNHRASTRDFVNNPKAEWRIDEVSADDLRYDTAVMKLRDINSRDIMLWFTVLGNDTVLHFKPAYEIHVARYEYQEGMLLNREPFQPYENCVETRHTCSKDEGTFQLYLSISEMQQLLSGNDLLIQTKTQFDEYVDFEFALNGLSEKIERVRYNQGKIEEILISLKIGIRDYLPAYLESGLDPNYYSEDQFLLNGLLSYGLFDAARLVVANGGNVNARDRDGKTPLHIAVFKRGGKEAIEWLINNGSNTALRDNRGQTALDIAKSRVKELNVDIEKHKDNNMRLIFIRSQLSSMNDIVELLE